MAWLVAAACALAKTQSLGHDVVVEDPEAVGGMDAELVNTVEDNRGTTAVVHSEARAVVGGSVVEEDRQHRDGVGQDMDSSHLADVRLDKLVPQGVGYVDRASYWQCAFRLCCRHSKSTGCINQ